MVEEREKNGSKIVSLFWAYVYYYNILDILGVVLEGEKCFFVMWAVNCLLGKVGGAQYDRSVSNGQKLIFYRLILELKNTTFEFFLTFYDVMHHIPCKF